MFGGRLADDGIFVSQHVADEFNEVYINKYKYASIHEWFNVSRENYIFAIDK